jgi:type II secretory pathway component PulF
MGIALLICVAGIPGYAWWAWKRPGLALGCLPLALAAVVLCAFAISEDTASQTCAVAALLIAVETVLIVRFGPCPSEFHQPWYKTVTRIINTLVRYGLFLAASVTLLRYFGPVLFVLVVTGIVHFKQIRRHAILMDIIGTLGAAIRQNLPLPMALNLDAGNRKSKAARIMRTIAHFLTQGYPLSQALQKGYPRCPADVVTAIAAGEAVDQLPGIIESVLADLLEKRDPSKNVRPVNPLYPVLVFVFLAIIATGVFIFIIPTFSEVIAEISEGQEFLPASTQIIFHLADTLIRHQYLILVSLLPAAGMGYYVWMVYFPRRPEKPRWANRIGDRITWYLPGIHWFEKTRSLLQLLKVLRVGHEGGWPVPVVIGKALGVDMNLCMQSRVSRWLREIERGEDVSRSAQACGLGHTLAWALDPTLQRGNVADLLAMLEEIYRTQYQYRLNLLNSFVCPLSILALGTCVGYVVYSMFAAIVSILNLTIQYTVP